MSVLLFGVSHRSAPVSVLEQLSTDESDQAKIVDQVMQSPLVTEAMVLSTCNRVEVYAVVDAFHGGLSVIGQVLSEHSGMSMGDLTKYAYVRYGEAAVEHLFAVASGLDSAVVGEQQVLGQVRRAYASAETNRTVGRMLHELAQRALSSANGCTPKPVSTPQAHRWCPWRSGWPTRSSTACRQTAVVVGAGAMGALSAAHLVRAGSATSTSSTARCPGRSGWPQIREAGAAAEARPRRARHRVGRRRRGGQLHRRGAPGGVVADVHHALAASRRDAAGRW